jgi:hypothetical protein
VYSGTWEDNNKSGTGTFRNFEGCQYTFTQFENNFKGPAQGSYSDPDGNFYTGEFFDGNFFGQGEYTDKDGNQYRGEFKSNVREGAGSMQYKNGDSYTGNYFQDERSGYGESTCLQSQTCYKGAWDNSKKNGFGELTD